MHNTQKGPGLYESLIDLPREFPLHTRLNGTRGDAPIEAFHTHNALEIGLCLEGVGTYYVAGKVMPFQEGDLAVLTPLEWHRSQSAGGTVSRWSWFFLDPARLLVPSVTQTLPYAPEDYAGEAFANVLPGDEYPELVSIFIEATNEVRDPGPNHRVTMRALLLVFLNRLHRCTERRLDVPQITEAPSRIIPALDTIARRYTEPLRVTELAKLCHMSVRSFQLHFQQRMGQTPQAYLIQCRVQAAIALLRATDQPITDVAFECGFGSLSSFNRAFRSQTGRTPRETRNGV